MKVGIKSKRVPTGATEAAILNREDRQQATGNRLRAPAANPRVRAVSYLLSAALYALINPRRCAATLKSVVDVTWDMASSNETIPPAYRVRMAWS